VRVAAEADRLAALLVEPAHLVDRGERAAGVHLERAAAAGERAEHRPVLLLEVLLLEPVPAAGPVAAGEVDVREHLEDVAVLDHAHDLGEVAAHRGLRVGIEQPPGTDEPAVVGERVQRAEDPVGRGRAQVRGDARGEQVRLARLDAGEDAQAGKAVPALGDLRCVALDVDRQLLGVVPVGEALGVRAVVLGPDGEVQVLGEGDRRQPQCHRTFAGTAHGHRLRGVPRPVGVHVVVRREVPTRVGLVGAHRLWILPRRPQVPLGGGGCRCRCLLSLP
jgi:hypothetical protein